MTSDLPELREPWFDCFYLYPTVDLRLIPGNHTDLDDHRAADAVIVQQFSAFAHLCRPFAPYYRQALLGTFLYLQEPEAKESLLQAFYDVAMAWEAYLENWNEKRPFILMGHSQGALLLTWLLHIYFETNRILHLSPLQLLDRLIAAYPIGDHLYTKKGAQTGGSLAFIPLCSETEPVGCIIHFRTAPIGFRSPSYNLDPVIKGLNNLGSEDPLLANPFDPDNHEIACALPLLAETRSSYFFTPAGESFVPVAPLDITPGVIVQPSLTVFLTFPKEINTGDLLLFPQRYFGFCGTSRNGLLFYIGLHGDASQLPSDPLHLASFLQNPLGTHILDYNLLLGNLLRDVSTRATMWQELRR